MIINVKGEIIEDLYMLFKPTIPVYLLDGEKPVLFDAGFAFLGERYVAEIKDILGNRMPYYLLLSHAHYDHCGAASFFKNSFPSLKAVSSARAKKILKRPNAIELIKQLNENARNSAIKGGMKHASVDVFEEFEIDMTVKENDEIKISENMTVRVLETPGHTRDCLSFYIPEKKLLMTSESFGIADNTGYILADFLVDYDIYFDSMKKMDALDIDVLCIGHNYAYTGADAKNYIRRSMTDCEKFLKFVEGLLLEENGDVDRVVTIVKEKEYDSQKGAKQPEQAYMLNLRARISVIKKRMGDDFK